jgi:hypothetical protein
MVKLFLINLALMLCFSGLFAHEEPAKTLKEKSDKEKARTEILKNKIISFTVWKHQIIDNRKDKMLKERVLTTTYDTGGNLSEMLVYKSNDTLDYRVAFGYDENNNMITDTDYNPEGSIAENIEYTYDESGRVAEQINYQGNGEIDSKFTYAIDNKTNTLIFNKYKPLDSIEYQIIYKYEGTVDNGNNTEIIKQKLNGGLILRVENIFNNTNQRKRKKIFDENNSLIYYFEYTYFEDCDKFSSITKYSPEDQVLSKTEYTLDNSGNIESVVITDNAGNIFSYSSYEYKIGK